MKKILFLAIFFSVLFWASFSQAASVGDDGGISLLVTFVGDLDTDMVVDLGGNPVNNPATGTQWHAKDKLEHDLGLFAQHVFQMTEGKHYLRNILVIDNDRSWANADIRWSNDAGLSTGALNGWDDRNHRITLRRCFRQNIHEVVSHEFGHYFYGLSDEYLTANASTVDYYQGHFSGTANFTVTITGDCTDTIMNNNNPYQFCDALDHSLTVNYTNPATAVNVAGEILTSALLADGNPNNDGPINNWINQPFAIDGWAMAGLNQTDLTGYHTDGVRPPFNAAAVPALNIEYVDQVGHAPGRILLLDRSGSMSHETFGIKASQYVQEAGLFLYHSSELTDYIGAFVYNDNTDQLFAYDQYDNNNNLINFYDPVSLTDIHKALKTALDSLVAEHGEDHVAGGEIFLMSDGRQTTGADLWLQVDRAKDLGVVIHTFSYGDADQAIMDQIASETNGEEFLMSENTDNLMNLKLRVIKSIAKIRGLIPVYENYGPLQKTGVNEKGVEYQKISFEVPPQCKDLKFYVFPEKRTEGSYEFTMKYDVSGAQVSSVSSQISSRGRFAGQRSKNPGDGKWTVTISGDPKYKRLPSGNVELIAYIDNPEIDGRVWMDQNVMMMTPADKEKLKVYASVFRGYPLTGVKTQVYFTDSSGKQIASVSMADDGKNGDERAGDGIYTGLVDKYRLIKMSKSLRLNLNARFYILKESIPAPNTEYEPGSDYKKLLKSYKPSVFEVYADRGITFTRKQFQPSVRLLTLAASKFFRPDKGALKIQMRNAFCNPKSLRAGLGKGVVVTGVACESMPKGLYTITYQISKTAPLGSRDLYLQFGAKKLKVKNAIVISDKKKEIRGRIV